MNFPYFLVHAKQPLIMYLSLSDRICLYLSSLGVRFKMKVLTRANHPNCLVSKKTIPHLETVAGEAWERSSTSNIIVIQLVSLMIYPDVRHNFLLSSRTVFMFSIQTASTGPSKTTHLRSLISAYSAHFLIKIAITPSDQLFVLGSNLPYNWSDVIDLGLSLSCCTFTKFCIPASEEIP